MALHRGLRRDVDRLDDLDDGGVEVTPAAEAAYLMAHLADECERAARFIRCYDKNPDALRAWARRIESGVAPKSVCVPATALENAAEEARRFLADADRFKRE